MWWTPIGMDFGFVSLVSFFSYFLTVTPPVNGFAELPTILVSSLTNAAGRQV